MFRNNLLHAQSGLRYARRCYFEFHIPNLSHAEADLFRLAGSDGCLRTNDVDLRLVPKGANMRVGNKFHLVQALLEQSQDVAIGLLWSPD